MAAAVVFLNYYDAINYFADGLYTVTGDVATAGIFATYPKGGFVGTFEALFD